MAATQVPSTLVKNQTINIDDIDITTTGKALITKVVAGTNIYISQTGVDAGTGVVTINVNNSKSISITSPGPTENISLFFTTVAITLTQILEAIQGTTPSVTYNINFASTRNASGTKIFTTDRTVTGASGTSVTSFNNSSIPANSYIWLTTSAASGTITDFSLTIIY